MEQPPGGRLSVGDWIEAGFAELAAGGPDALRVSRLCTRLGVTKGSFYWHFADIASYRAALVQAWADEREQRDAKATEPPDVDPRERLRRMMEILLDNRHWAVARVMRIWALTNDAVAVSVRRSDERVLRTARQAFTDTGFDVAQAHLRATLAVAANAGLLMTDATAPNIPTEVRERFLDFMFRP
ncbi:TetR/AcrR family transcriptional regulator [Mycolicibacterium thermoresistibile]